MVAACGGAEGGAPGEYAITDTPISVPSGCAGHVSEQRHSVAKVAGSEWTHGSERITSSSPSGFASEWTENEVRFKRVMLLRGDGLLHGRVCYDIPGCADRYVAGDCSSSGSLHSVGAPH